MFETNIYVSWHKYKKSKILHWTEWYSTSAAGLDANDSSLFPKNQSLQKDWIFVKLENIQKNVP